jgi:hypothetical protein
MRGDRPVRLAPFISPLYLGSHIRTKNEDEEMNSRAFLVSARTRRLLIAGVIASGVLALLGSTPVAAQACSREDRSISLERTGPILGSNSGALQLSLSWWGAVGNANISEYVAEVDPLTGSFDIIPHSSSATSISMSHAGDADATVSFSTIFLAGADWDEVCSTRTGVLAVLQRNPVAHALHGTFSSPGSDFVGVAYAEAIQVLYLLDAGQNLLLKASYAPGSAVPTNWTTLLTGSQFPPLLDAFHLELSIEEITPAGTVTLRLDPHDSPSLLEFHKVVDGPGGVVSESVNGVPRPFLSGGTLIATSLPATVSVRGTASTSAELVCLETGLVVASGILGPNGHADLQLSTALQAGRVYATRSGSSGDLNPPFRVAIRSWGAASSLGNGSSIRPFDDGAGMTAFVDNEFYSLGLVLDHTNPNTAIAPAQYQAILVLGGEFDIVQLGPSFVLVSPIALTTTATVDSPNLPGVAQVNFPIPDDPSLIGSTICFQWWVESSPGVFVSSEIAGVVVRASRFTFASLQEYLQD